jgi:apolipoprotein N-acyltransferase
MSFKPNNFLLSLFSAALLSLSWYFGFTLLIFFSFVPLLFIEDYYSKQIQIPKRKLKQWGFFYITFFLWNILVTWWIVYASVGGACMAIIANALLMSIVFLIFSNVKNRINKSWAIWFLIPIWIAFEHLHTLWDITWTWLTLGNVFAFHHQWVQWYEFTGTSGGTFWVLFTNILIFSTIKNYSSLKIISKPILKIATIIILPILASYLIIVFTKPLTNKNKCNVVVVQPNIDPYNDKFFLDYQSQFLKALNLIKGKVSTETDYLVFPETFITDNLNEEVIKKEESIEWFKDSLISKYPNLKIIVGASSYYIYRDEKKISVTARIEQGIGKYVDFYNTALQIDTSSIQLYHKSKLVPGVELMPFPALLKPLEKLAINMGGTMGSLGMQKDRVNFSDGKNVIKIAPVICYESIFADYVTEYIRGGANFIFIITNDGWWENTPGHVQHLNYARLRAIENRRQIARSANTGISCFIDEFGNISEETKYWETAVIQKDMAPNFQLTFFSRFGDLISYISSVVAVLIVLFSSFLRFKK